jgi:hypothetical protein
LNLETEGIAGFRNLRGMIQMNMAVVEPVIAHARPADAMARGVSIHPK